MLVSTNRTIMDLGTTEPISGRELTNGLGNPPLLGRQSIELCIVCGEGPQEIGDERADRCARFGGPDPRRPVHVVWNRYGDVLHSHTVSQFHRKCGLSRSSCRSRLRGCSDHEICVLGNLMHQYAVPDS
jgi:hypothetical protein